MTPSNPPPFTVTVETEDGTVLVRVAGDLDFETCDELMKAVERCLGDRRDAGEEPADLRVDFSGLGSIDSTGLSTLLMIRRLTDLAGVRLHLDERPLALDRLLGITATLHHLTAPRAEHGGERRPGTG
ncbi:STAS domain-containing protein [Streptomyces sp. RPA4-2]|uniref:STAS domain-containing protein n=1 Tax=Streptomyces sp. RPA4-2 TaxID=2721244 RepID=UPI00143E8FCE|nr:STAS domain-containing protein [Streptomyces sp. RPA4-2]QIY66849.1 STAS domain-containing protein [Streptomyces sp. RPA4-2]